MAPPVIILGVGRSGTTLLRVMLDRNSELAIPYETFFVPQLAHRHRSKPQIDAFVDDLGRLRTLFDWGVTPEDVRPRLRGAMTTGEAIAANLELRYEDLVREPEQELRRICEFASLPWEPGMLDHTRVSDAANLPEHRNLAQPPTPGLRDWYSQMSRDDALAFERIAGDVLRN